MKDEKIPFSKQWKTGSRFPYIHSKTKTESKLHLQQQQAKETVKLPEIDHKPGNTHHIVKVNYKA